MISIFSSFGQARSDSENILLFSKQISWAAANLENPEVIQKFQRSYKQFQTDKEFKAELESTADGKKLLQQGENLIRVVGLQKDLRECSLEQASALGIRETIAKALGIQALSSEVCSRLENRAPKVLRFQKNLVDHFQSKARDQIVLKARKSLQQTQTYWMEIEKQNPVDQAILLTEQELDKRTPQEGVELLLYTKALKDRENKIYISANDVRKALDEVKSELKTHQDYLQEVAGESGETALRRLVVTNPGAVAQYLIEHPESLDMICQVLKSVDVSMARNEKLDSVFLWGGLVIAGVLIASGVGALAGGALAGTLTTVAAGAALAGTVGGVGDALYSSSKTHEAFIEAQNIRSSAYVEGLSPEAQARIEKANDQAYSELQGAGFSALSIVPFGAGFKVMKSVAQSTRLGSLSKVAAEGAKVEAESISSLAKVLKQVSSDKEVYQALGHGRARIPEEEMAQFLGHLSGMTELEKKKVFAAIKAHPERVPDAIRESTQKGVCK